MIDITWCYFVVLNYLDDIQTKEPSITKDPQAEVSRRRHGLCGNNYDKRRDAFLFLLEETPGCYDVSVSNARHCLVINKTTRDNFKKAEQDYNIIHKTMTALKFRMSFSNGCDKLKNRIKECTAHENMGCFFCFLQIDAESATIENKLVAEVIESVKRERCMLTKPKVYIIQPYQTAVVRETDFVTDDIEKDLTQPVLHSKESDVLMVFVLPVKFGKKSFIELFCNEYVDNAEKVPMLDFLERFLPGKYENDWISLVPTVFSTMTKHLIIKDSFARASYKSEYNKTTGVFLDVVDTFANGLRKICPKLWQKTIRDKQNRPSNTKLTPTPTKHVGKTQEFSSMSKAFKNLERQF
ncbi:uncharacterized protein [Mytilus edulis]|uniref:uncharacterized protein n=1 Tax=Mytilus edulis TaxID=6550 RepID=UPI0039EF00CF